MMSATNNSMVYDLGLICSTRSAYTLGIVIVAFLMVCVGLHGERVFLDNRYRRTWSSRSSEALMMASTSPEDMAVCMATTAFRSAADLILGPAGSGRRPGRGLLGEQARKTGSQCHDTGENHSFHLTGLLQFSLLA